MTAAPVAGGVGLSWWRVGQACARAWVAACAALFLGGLVLWAHGSRSAAAVWAMPDSWTEDAFRSVVADAGIPFGLAAAYPMLLEVLVAAAGLTAAVLVLRGADTWFRLYVAAALSLWSTMGGAMSVVYRDALGGSTGEAVQLLQGLGWAAWILIAYLFPDGRVVPRWSRWAMAGWPAYFGYVLLLPVAGHEPDPDSLVETWPLPLLFGSAAWAAIHRYRRVSTPEQRRQTRGVVVALALWAVLALVAVLTPLRGLLDDVGVGALVGNAAVQLVSYLIAGLLLASITVAVLRHGLYDVDLWVNRALVYAVLTGLVVAAYAVLAGIGGLIWPANDLAGPLAATVVVAVAFHPLRLRVQRVVDRFVYGRSLDPLALLTELRESRERILVAREDERRRLQRDLHDGLGPTLASLYQRMDAARSLMRQDPDTADRLLADVAEQTRGVIGDIRALVRDLRPPELEQLGLVGALQAAGDRFEGLAVEVDADGLGSMPPVVETAAYRIATEAVTNAARHAAARTIRVRLASDGRTLWLTVRDDGVGLGAAPPGTGLHSMRDRAEELGGACEIATPPGGGTEVTARLPLGAATARRQR
ncbi:sensor histidine kinase [Nocardioides humi]|uniref:Histidine kinase/HSP90-like ATPase domain-containing protein n=1 Tax=Nocardioides humi TaxID=449461 RepID=A0ABN1ZPH6_9ACTN|nr:sensor histidine kinase [Nocardioides humi]